VIYLFHGTDGERARGKWRAVIETFAKKYPTGAIFRPDAEHFSAEQFEELAQGSDLFGEKRLVAADRLLENELALAFVSEALDLIAASPTVFVFLETAPLKDFLRAVEKAGGKVEGFEAKFVKHSVFNIFALADALGARDRRQLWVLFQAAQFAGLPAEEIFWKLVWQTKMMLLVSRTADQSADKAERELKTVKPFVAGKAARYAKNYQPGELEKLSGDLVALWHQSKSEHPRDLAVGLERLILGL